MRLIVLLFGLFCFEPAWAQRVITTVAGTDWLFPGDGRPAKNAPIGGASGLDVALDSAGNLYVCDDDNFAVFKVTPDGIIHNFAGNGFGNSFDSGDEGLAVNAALFFPISVAVDPSGNVYIGEYYGTIRKVTPDGIIHAFAGTGNVGYSGDNGPATLAELSIPYGLATDRSGNLYVADTGNNVIRKITPDGTITTIAGTGQAGSVGENVPATKAQLFGPVRLALDTHGNIYFTETFDVNVVAHVRKIDTNGIITSVAGGGLDPSDGIPAAQAGLLPQAVSVDAAGNLYIEDFTTYTLRVVDTKGIIRTIAGTIYKPGFTGDGGKATNATLHFGLQPGLVVDPSGVIYIGDDGNTRVRRITLDGIIDTVVGNGLFRFSGDGGPATSATLYYPIGITGDSSGNLYVAESYPSRIRKIDSKGIISVYAGNHGSSYSGDGGPAVFASLNTPGHMTMGPDGSVVVADSINCVIRSINPAGVISTIAGNGRCTYAGDGGPALQASLAGPSGVAFDGAGDLFISDTYNNRIRVVAASNGKIATITGDGTAAFAGDGGPSIKGEVYRPGGLIVHGGAIYFADTYNSRIRKIDFTSGNITTVAGNGNPAYSGDGGQATAASLKFPDSLTFDTSGNMYIADTRNSVVRKVDTNGVISTFAGQNPFGQMNDGGLATNAALPAPEDIFIDSNGNFFITDLYYSRVRELPALRPTFQLSTLSLAYTAQAGSSAQDQRVDLTGGISGIPFTVASSAPWLTTSLQSGQMPLGLTVTATPGTLAPGTYQGTVTITAPTTATVSQFLRVTLTVTAAGQPTLSVKPISINYSTVVNSPGVTRGITVSNAGGGSISYTARATTVSGGPWLTLSAGSGTVGPFASQSLTASLNPAGLVAGTYSGTVTISSASPAQSVTVAVTMIVTQTQQTLLIPQSGLTFYAVAGGGKPSPQFFSILNTGHGQMNYTVQFTTLSGGTWLSVFPGAGSSTAESNQVPQERVDVDPSGLQGGVYYGTVQVVAPTASNNPQFVSVVLNVLPPGSHIGPIVEPTGLLFTAFAGTSPGSRTITIQNANTGSLTFQTGATTVDGFPWLASLPLAGTVSQAQPTTIVVQPQTDTLNPNVYRGSLTLSFSDGSVRVVNIVVVVIPAGGNGSTAPLVSRSKRLPKGGAALGCTPRTLVPVFTQVASGFSTGFSATGGFPGEVNVDVVDDCGNAMVTGDVIASFSNGDPPLRLTSLKDGNWAGTWTPGKIISPTTVTADAEIPDQNLKGEASLTGSVQSGDAAAPLLGAGQVVNGASFLPTLSPGSFVTLFGSKLAQSTSLAPSVPLPTTLAGSTVYAGGNPIPVYYTSDGQVNAILPYGLQVNSTQPVFVSRGTALSVPQGVTIAAAAPGIFATASGQGIVEGFDGSAYTLADASHPVQAGQTIVIYCTGLGEVDPPVVAGSPTPMSPISSTVNPVTLTIGGIPAQVAFAGLTPGQTGLYQVNAVVPQGVTPGNQVQVVMTAAGQQSAPVTIAVK